MPVPPSERHHPPDCTCLDHPWHETLLVREARDAYLAENGFSVEGYAAPRAEGSIFGIRFSVPNPPAHQRAIRLHDLFHVATGYGTDHAGEAEISVLQLRRGFEGAGHVLVPIALYNIVVGLVAAPRRTLRAFLRAQPGPTPFSLREPYETLLDLTVAEFRTRLGIPTEGLARTPRGRHAFAPPSDHR